MNKAVTHNALWLILGQVARMGIQLVVGVLTARYLGPANFGLIHYAAAYTGFFASVCTLGFPSTLVRELTDAPGEEGGILGTALSLRLFSGIGSAMTVSCLAAGIHRNDPIVSAVVGCSGAAMALQAFEVLHCWFQYRLQSKVTAMVTLAAYGITAGFRVYLLVTGKSVVWFAFAGVVEAFCGAAFLLAAYRRSGGSRLYISREKARGLLKRSCHFILPGLLAAVYAQTDKLMLGSLLGEAEVGFYCTAVSLCNSWCFVLSALIDSMYPEITKAHKTRSTLFFRRNRQLYAGVFYLSTAVSGILFCFSGVLVRLLYGDAFLPAAGVLRVLTWYTAFSYLGVARNAWVVCMNGQKYLIWIYGAAAICNVALNYLLIPIWGAVGAAAASLAAQVLTTVILPAFFKELRENVRLMVQAIVLRDVFGEKTL